MARAKGRRGAVRWARMRETAPWSEDLARTICERVAGGEMLYPVLREKGMPTPQSVARWARERPEFGADLLEARRIGGRPVRGVDSLGRVKAGGGVWSYCEEAAEAVFERLCDGESLTSIGHDPTMPSLSTIFHWRRCIPDFDDAVTRGQRISAERVCDLGWEMAKAATPETAYLTHVQLAHLRWKAGVMAPRAFKPRPVEPEAPQKTMSILMRNFEIEVDEETGEKRVVAYCPNPLTGEVEREDTPGWRPPGDKTMIPMPGGRYGR